MSFIWGIDIGIQGGLVLLENGKIKEMHPMPIFEVQTSTKKARKYCDANAIKEIIKKHERSAFYIEQVRSMHMMSAQSNFSFGHSAGVIEACVRMIADEYHLIRAVDWQKKVWHPDDYVFKDGKRNTKATSLNAAKRIFPNESFLKSKRCSVPHDGLIDAALIACSQF